MLETASSQSKHELTRYETLLLSIFRDGTISRKHLDGQFRSLLAVQPENDVATHALDSAFDGLVRKGLIKSVKRSVEFTKKGRTELQRLSDIVDAVYDQLIGTLRGRHRKALQDLMRKIGSP